MLTQHLILFPLCFSTSTPASAPSSSFLYPSPPSSFPSSLCPWSPCEGQPALWHSCWLCHYFWTILVSLYVCVREKERERERLMKRGKGTHAKMTRACIRAADVSEQPPFSLTHFPFPLLMPNSPFVNPICSLLFFFLLLSSHPLTCPSILSPSTHPSSILPPSLQLLALHPLLFVHPSTPSFLSPFYSSFPSLLLFSSSPDVLFLSSRLPCSFLSLLPPALWVSLSQADFLTSRGPVTALHEPPTPRSSFRLLSLSQCPPYKLRQWIFKSLNKGWTVISGFPCCLQIYWV